MCILVLAKKEESFPIKKKKKIIIFRKEKMYYALGWEVKTEILHANSLFSLHRYFVLLIIHWGKA